MHEVPKDILGMCRTCSAHMSPGYLDTQSTLTALWITKALWSSLLSTFEHSETLWSAFWGIFKHSKNTLDLEDTEAL